MKIINKKILLIIIAVFITVVLAIGILYKIGIFVKKDIINADRDNSSYDTNENGVFISNNISEIGDQDLDGISDEEEQKLGTLNNDFDSDSDGVNDKLELKYGTDPTNPDTDGDGYPDGLEIIRGYNPLGEGELNQ